MKGIPHPGYRRRALLFRNSTGCSLHSGKLRRDAAGDGTAENWRAGTSGTAAAGRKGKTTAWIAEAAVTVWNAGEASGSAAAEMTGCAGEEAVAVWSARRISGSAAAEMTGCAGETGEKTEAEEEAGTATAAADSGTAVMST